MRKAYKNAVALTAALSLSLTGIFAVSAAVTPTLGTASTFSILAGTFTNTSAATIINGDIGFTTGPFLAPLGTQLNYGPGVPTPQARIDVSDALSTGLAPQTCTPAFTFGSTTDLSLLPQPLTSGVYCIAGDASIGSAGITLSGTGTFIFRINGSLTSVDNSVVTLSPLTSACDVFWTPTAATTLGATTVFGGIIIDNANAITIGANTTLLGRALSLGAGSVTTGDSSVITAPNCIIPPVNATLNVIKQVINISGGVSLPSQFNLHVKFTGTDVSGSPAFGTGAPGVSYSLNAGNYTVSEDTNASYARTFSGSCDSSGNVTLIGGDNKTCIVINTFIPPVINNGGGGGSVLSTDSCQNGDYSSSYYDGICGTAPATSNTGTSTGTVTAIIPAPIISTGSVVTVVPVSEVTQSVPVNSTAEVVETSVPTPGLPDTGFAPEEKNNVGIIAMIASIFALISISMSVILKRRSM
ncbi:MAG: ice-binding family protein [Candidatus Gracilibacteria bacterium]|nr:ice-binding family protein [Candidatus Gracilibacteria bacterium]